MKKIFFEQDYSRKELFDKYNKRENEVIEDNQTKKEYLRYLLYQAGRNFYVQENFDLANFTADLVKWFQEKNKMKVEQLQEDDIHIIKTTPSSKVAKFIGISRATAIVISKQRNYLSFIFVPYDWPENPKIDKKIEKNSWFSTIVVDNIEKFIFEYIIQNNPDKEFLDYASTDNYYVEDLKPKYQQFFLSERQEDEILLAWLNVSSLKKLAQNKDFSKNTHWYYVLTNFDSLLLGFDKNGDVVDAFELQNRQMTIKKSLRVTVEVDTYQWLTTMTNGSKFKDVANCPPLDANMRINQIAKMNVAKSKNFKYYDFSKFLLSNLKDVISPFTIFLLSYIENPQKATDDYKKEDRLSLILANILNSTQSEELLVFWYNDWMLNAEQSVFVMKMLIEATENKQQLKELFPLHSLIYKSISKGEKDSYNKILYDIEFSRHLIAIDKSSEAEKILKKDLKIIPDEQAIDLLPPENVNPTGDCSGKFLRVLILDMIAEIQNSPKANETIREIAELQPLSAERLQNLKDIAEPELSAKAEKIISILEGSGLESNDEVNIFKFNTLSNKDIDKVKHPSVRKKGTLNSFSKWVSSYKNPDFSVVKQFADRFSPTKHKNIEDIVSDLIHFFNFENLEVYIAHGEQSVGIRAFDAETPFLMIGSDHLDSSSPYYLTYNELRFKISSELAFLYFKFSKITSNDIWRGAMEKGNFVLETAISVIPFAGSLGSLAKNATKIKIFSNFVEKNKQITKLLSKSQQILSVSERTSGILTIASQMLAAIKSVNPSKDTIKKEQLIAISRMMQVTADRVGLLISNDPVSAVRGTFLTSKNLIENLSYSQKYGINSFLLKKNNDNNYCNLNFAVRFADIFSFWISKDFEDLRKNIVI